MMKEPGCECVAYKERSCECATCGKTITNFGRRPTQYGVAIQVIVKGEDTDTKYLEEQFAPYPVKDYFVCWGCFLKALGVPVPLSEREKCKKIYDEITRGEKDG